MSRSVWRTAPVLGAMLATLLVPVAARAQEATVTPPMDIAVARIPPVAATPALRASIAASPTAATPALVPVAAVTAPAATLAQASAPPPPPPAPPAEGARADQDTRTPPPPPPAAPPPGAPRAIARPGQPRPAAAPELPGDQRARYVSKGVNIRIDAAITDSRGEQVLGKKVVTVTVVDGRSGQVRSTQQVPFHMKGTNGFSYQNAPLNMDAEALLREDGRVIVSLTLDYRGGAPDVGNEADAAPPSGDRVSGTLDQGILQSVTVVLESGKPLIVAQSADAVGDRRVALELKATVLK